MLSPLDAASLSKSDIRTLSHEAGLPTWDEPASACLSSRIPYHSEVTDEKLRVIEDSEEALRTLGFRILRVRHHGDVARIELARDELARALEPELSVAEQLALEFQTGAARLALRLEQRSSPITQLAAQLDPLQREVERLRKFSVPNRLYAYCFCSAD